MRQPLYIVLLITVLCGCTNVADRVVSNIENKCPAKACIIKLTDATDFAWDRLYIFGSWTETDSISRTIGFNFPGSDVPDDYHRLVFTKGDEVVHQEDFNAFTSAIEIDEDIDSLSRTKGSYLTPAKAIFRVRKSKGNGSCENCYFYFLTR